MLWNVTTYFSVMIESSSAAPVTVPGTANNPAATRSELRLSRAVVSSLVRYAVSAMISWFSACVASGWRKSGPQRVPLAPSAPQPLRWWPG